MSDQFNPYKFHLVGSLEGKTINLGGHHFVEGVYTFTTDDPHVLPSEDECKLKANYLAKSYQAYQEGSTELAEARKKLKGGEAANEGELKIEERERQEQDDAAEKPVQQRQVDGAIRTAITKLDPKNDEQWTNAGLPSVEVVRKLAENDGVTRADITRLAPNLNREEAAKVAAGGGDPLD